MEVQNIISKPIWWTGTILKVLLCLFLLFDAIMKVIKNQQSVESTMKIGLPESCVQFLGAYILVSTALYINQRTVMMGCLFLLAYLGGAVAITYRAGILVVDKFHGDKYKGFSCIVGLFWRQLGLTSSITLM